MNIKFASIFQFRACADVSIQESDGSADNTPSRIPEYTDEETQDYNDLDNEIYNEIDVGPRTSYDNPYVESNHVGHVVALTLSFLLILLVIFGLIVYFYWAQDAFKDFIRKQKLKWINTEPPSIVIPSGKLSPINSISFPVDSKAPIVPSRKKKAPPLPPGPPAPQRLIRSISPPTNVSINGVKVCPEHSGQENTIHTPDD